MIDSATEPFVPVETTFAASAWTIDGTTICDQPGFGIAINWWHPDRKHKPFVVVAIWRWRVQIGWLSW